MSKPDIKYTLSIEPETEPYVGNCSAWDDETDRKQEQWIRDQLAADNDWAWCSVCVTARFGDFEGETHLGCCSYDSEESFKASGQLVDGVFRGSYGDMCKEALVVLTDRIDSAGAQVDEWRSGS